MRAVTIVTVASMMKQNGIIINRADAMQKSMNHQNQMIIGSLVQYASL